MFFAINIKSTHITLNHGVPQGSPITPILFILYVSDLPLPTHEYKVHRSQFADDICDFTSAKQTRFIQQQLQNSINQIITYSGVYRIGLNAGKAAQIFFPGKRHTSEKNIKHVTINNTNISIHNKVKFLGVTFDSSLSFTTHIKLIASKAKHRIMRPHTASCAHTPHHAPTHHLQPVIRSISNHHESLMQNIRAPTFRIRPHRHHHRIIQKHKHLGRHPIQIHQKYPGPSPHIQSKCRQIWELFIHQTTSSTPFQSLV